MHGAGLQLALVFLLAAVLAVPAVPMFKRFGLGAVLGYLPAGVLLGRTRWRWCGIQSGFICFLRYSRRKRAIETVAGPLLGGASSAATST